MRPRPFGPRARNWLAASGVIAEKTLELSSYHAIVACVAAGTGIALAPRSVLEVVRGADSVAVYALPARSRRAMTSLVWRKGETSWALKALQAELTTSIRTSPLFGEQRASERHIRKSEPPVVGEQRASQRRPLRT